jgi:hypothetical protein
MNKNLDRIEAQLKKLFEQSLLKIFFNVQEGPTLIEDLMHAMRDNLQTAIDGEIYAPDNYVIEVSPHDLSEWQAHQDILDEMAESIYNIGKAEGFEFIKTPEIILKSDPSSVHHNFVIHAKVSKQSTQLPDTAAMTQAERKAISPSLPENAILVIGGKTNFTLEKPVIDIGRHSQNDLVLDDLHVSRHHAQLRAINEQYVIFDVGSTGGIFLNERKITRATLQSGDVIRIGLVNLIYVQESTSGYSTHAVPIETEYDSPGDMME